MEIVEIKKLLTELRDIIEEIGEKYYQVSDKERLLFRYLTERLDHHNPYPHRFISKNNEISLEVTHSDIAFTSQKYYLYEMVTRYPDILISLLREAIDYYKNKDKHLTDKLENLTRIVNILKTVVENR
ncbi:MAG: hypothetical protein DRP27_06355 [Thermotogae bacterium]|nr:MAG: hypothetical protein DRP27_06355 [Thermotogota bacterium]